MVTDSAAPPSGYVQPVIDVQALAELLDGEYAKVRSLVRSNLTTYAGVLDEAEQLGFDEFRERVRDLVVDGGNRADRHRVPEGVRRWR